MGSVKRTFDIPLRKNMSPCHECLCNGHACFEQNFWKQSKDIYPCCALPFCQKQNKVRNLMQCHNWIDIPHWCNATFKPTYRIKMNVQLLTWRAYLLAVRSVTGWKTLHETTFSQFRITWCRNIVDPAFLQSTSALANSFITSVKILSHIAFCSVFFESKNKVESGTHDSCSPSKYMLVFSKPTVASKVPSDLKSFFGGTTLFSTYDFLKPVWTAWTLSSCSKLSAERPCSLWHLTLCSFILRSDTWREKFSPRGHNGHLLQYVYDVPQPDIL